MPKSPATQLQEQYYSLLNGNITYDGDTIPVYDVVPDNETYPYIQLGDYTETDDSSKGDFGDECTFSISVVDRFQGRFGSDAGIYSVWNDIKDIIRARPTAFDMTDFYVNSTVVDNAVTREEKTETYMYKILEGRFRHLIREI